MLKFFDNRGSTGATTR